MIPASRRAARKCRNTHFWMVKSVSFRPAGFKDLGRILPATFLSMEKCVFLHFRAARRGAEIADGVVICSPNRISAFSWKPGFVPSRARETVYFGVWAGGPGGKIWSVGWGAREIIWSVGWGAWEIIWSVGWGAWGKNPGGKGGEGGGLELTRTAPPPLPQTLSPQKRYLLKQSLGGNGKLGFQSICLIRKNWSGFQGNQLVLKQLEKKLERFPGQSICLEKNWSGPAADPGNHRNTYKTCGFLASLVISGPQRRLPPSAKSWTGAVWGGSQLVLKKNWGGLGRVPVCLKRKNWRRPARSASFLD